MSNTIEQAIWGDVHLRVDFLTDRMVRIRAAEDGSFDETGLNRYGFITEPEPSGLNVEFAEGKTGLEAKCGRLRLRVEKDNEAIVLEHAETGDEILRQVDVQCGDAGSMARFAAQADEDWVGFGDQTRDRLYHHGHVCDLHVCNVKSYIPVPFFMSTRGYGVLINATHRIRCDMAASDPNHFSWNTGRSQVDYYVMVGRDYRELLDLYTDLTGKPKLPPEWAFGLWYICRTQANDFEAVSDALNFRRERIPCDVLGLEPGWMEKNYDLSIDKSWSKDRFPIPRYAYKGPHNFFNAIQRMGFHMELWLCNEYDLSYEAERRVAALKPSSEAGESAGHFQKDAEQDEHFEHVRRADHLTKEDEPWFEHLKKFVDQGIDFFKQDGAFQVLEHPDRVWGNGMLDAEMHNLYPLLYVRQMYEGFAEHTGRRPVVFTPAGWAGFQAWCGTWTGDTGGRLPTLGAMLNTSMVGHSWATNDMEVAEKEGIHFGYLQPWSQINSWNYFRMPCVQGDELCRMHKDYGRLRSRLIPYLYSWARHATKTGYPLMVPLVLEFQNDPICRDNRHQYLLGRDLLVCIYEKDVYLPAGLWKDFWTGEVLEGGRHVTISWPENRGGGLFVRSGGIVPFGPLMQFRGQKPLDEIDIYLFPGERESGLEFYEDDGVSLKHLDGEYATTELRTVDRDDTVLVEIGETQGTFDGQCRDRAWHLTIAMERGPAAVLANGEAAEPETWTYDPERCELRLRGLKGPVQVEAAKNATV